MGVGKVKLMCETKYSACSASAVLRTACSASAVLRTACSASAVLRTACSASVALRKRARRVLLSVVAAGSAAVHGGRGWRGWTAAEVSVYGSATLCLQRP